MRQTLSLIFLFITAACFSQINYEPGYFINNNGARTECLIKNIAWKDNPTGFNYRQSEGGEVKTATISEVKEFDVNGYKFKRFNVKIERSSNLASKMDTKRDIDWKDETLYLKVMVEGKAALYQYEGDGVVKYFYSTGDHTTAEQLLYKEFVVDTRINEINQFRQQLYNLMKAEIPSAGRFKKLAYTKEHLVDIFNEYNEANGSRVNDYTEKQNKSSLHLKITPGISFASLETSNDLISQARHTFGNKTTFRAGIEIEYIMPFNNRKWSFFIDPNYQVYKNESVKDDTKMAVEYSYIQVPVGVRHYFFLNDDSRIFLNAMAAFNFNLGNSFITYNNREPLEITKNTNYAIGAGFAFGNLSLEARYNFTNGILKNYTRWTADYSSYNIILGYRFL